MVSSPPSPPPPFSAGGRKIISLSKRKRNVTRCSPRRILVYLSAALLFAVVWMHRILYSTWSAPVPVSVPASVLAAPLVVPASIPRPPPAPGAVVLGMHRSGTSVLCGLLVTGLGYSVGRPNKLLDTKPENPLGYFERKDVVWPSDTMLKKEVGGWNGDVVAFDNDAAIGGGKLLEYGMARSALAFLNDAAEQPWVLKDPRMCVLLPTWLHHVKGRPAVVFTFRDPLEVAASLSKRTLYKRTDMTKWLGLWIDYNRLAVQHSAGLCRVLTSAEALLADPFGEGARIGAALGACGAPPPRTLTRATAESFVDASLRHKKERGGGTPLETYRGCAIGDYDGSDAHAGERDMYVRAMRVYCDLQSRRAFETEYPWPATG